MTISTTTNTVSYAGNSATTFFPIPFYFILATDLVVTETTGSTVLSLGLNADYSVSGAGEISGGSLAVYIATATGTTLTISRVEPVTQLTDYVQDDAFSAESHEKALDKLTMICQQLQTNIDNAVLASTTEGEANTASNLGGGLNVFKQKSTLDLQFRTISSPSGGTIGMEIAGDRIEIDVTYLLGEANQWTGGMQNLEYTLGTTGGLGDHVGWSGLVHNQTSGSNKDNMIGLRGHVYHDGAFHNDAGGIWGLTTEAWSNTQGMTTMVGGELSVISQHSGNTFPIIGNNLVFKNRLDVATHPAAPIETGGSFNKESSALFISSQARPSGVGAAWSEVGSGWNSAIRIGDVGFGSGLDWESGNLYDPATHPELWVGEPETWPPQKQYSAILDLTKIMDVVHGSGKDLGGGYPWLALWKTGNTYFGIRFVSQISTGEIENAVVAIAGSGYNVDDEGQIINIYGGVAATYKVKTLVGGAGTGVATIEILTPGTLFHTRPASVPYTTVHTSGTGNDLLAIEVKQVTGERIEFWRCNNPGDLTTHDFTFAQRYGFIDLSWTEFAQDGSFIRNHN